MIPDGATVGEVGELALVRHLRSRIPAGEGVTVGVGDDAAAVTTGPLTLVTTDVLVEGVHFRPEWTPPRLLGRRALSINLSDVGAMGGLPRYATVSLCLPANLAASWVDDLYDGLLERAAETGVSLVGGNVSAIDGPTVIDVAVLGHADRILQRSGAVPGDLVVVTGALGAAAAGLVLLRQGARLGPEAELLHLGIWTESSREAVQSCLRAQLDPSPPLAFARALAENEIAHAAMDLSDGLSGDLARMSEESNVAAFIDGAVLPVSPHAQAVLRAQGGDAVNTALHGGEDYQMLLAVPRERMDDLVDLAVVWNLPVTAIGEFRPGSGLSIRRGEFEEILEPRSHEHFRSKMAPRTASAAGASS